MANPVITAAILLEANGAALNNSGEPIQNARTANTMSVKAIWSGGKRYPYVSGQAWRRWWRETLYQDFDWTPSPVTREAKSAYTLGDPVNYEDDDLFGYMAAKKRDRNKRAKVENAGTDVPPKEEDATDTQRRVSPLKNSLLISVLPNTIEQDFAHFSRGLSADKPDPVPFEFEHYSTYLQGVFALSLRDIGRFEIGKMRDLPEKYESKAVKINEDSGLKIATIPADKRKERASQCINALAQLRHGANLTRNLSDVTPVAVIIGFMDGGNAPFQRVFRCTDDGYGVEIGIRRLETIMADYENRLMLSSERKVTVTIDKEEKLEIGASVLFGALPGVVTNEEKIKSLKGIYHAGSAVNAIRLASLMIESGEWLSEIWG